METSHMHRDEYSSELQTNVKCKMWVHESMPIINEQEQSTFLKTGKLGGYTGMENFDYASITVKTGFRKNH